MEYTLSLDAYKTMILHSAKYPNLPVSGFLIGSKFDAKIDSSIPFSHHPLIPSPTLKAALEQVTIYLKAKNKFIVGIYFGNDVNCDDQVHPAIDLLARKIDLELGGDSVLIRVFLD
jgi:hypothetical protein